MSPNRKELHIITGLFTSLLSFRVLTSHLLSLRKNVIIINRDCLLITESLVFKHAALTGIKLQNRHCNSFLLTSRRELLSSTILPTGQQWLFITELIGRRSPESKMRVTLFSGPCTASWRCAQASSYTK
jgi:hypothetical protein